MSELQEKIKSTLDENLDSCYWISGEINELKINSGHCYLELIQKDDNSKYIRAKAQAVIWAYTFNILKPYFESVTGKFLECGLKISVKVGVQYHRLYGLSLNVTDIDPVYTVGELQIRRNRIVEKLRDSGIFDMNRELEFPMLPKRIAVISSERSAGYEDFVNHLSDNVYGYSFATRLFDSTMQGAGAERSITDSLDDIYENKDDFDVAVIIRGGGAQSDLTCFDSFELASNVAQFPLPCLTGIGHNKDLSITDMTAYVMLKTPTAVADFLIGKFIEAETRLNSFRTIITQQIGKFVALRDDKVATLFSALSSNINRILLKEKIKTDGMSVLIKGGTKHITESESLKISNLASKIKLYDPANILRRGYSLTLHKGKIVNDSTRLEEGDILETVMFERKIKSSVTK